MEEPNSAQTAPPTEVPNPNQNPNPNPNSNSNPNPNPTPNSNHNLNPNPTPNPNPPNTAQNLPPRPPAPAPPLAPESKKRPLDQNGHIQDSKYFKMRAVLKGLRPHFIEVLRTPVFHNCKAAHEIRDQLKLLMDLYKEMTAETITMGKSKSMPEGPLSSTIQDGHKPQDHHQDVKPVMGPPPDRPYAKASEEKPILLANLSEKQQTQGTYIVGGSAFGWNFITYPGSKAVYYGRTKEMFRSANEIP